MPETERQRLGWVKDEWWTGVAILGSKARTRP
jgi:hypothetical protein